MNTTTNDIKKGLKSIQDSLRKISIQLAYNSNVTPYKNSLKEFGLKLLELENNNFSFRLCYGYTENGTIKINSFGHLAQLIENKIVTCVRIEAEKQYNSFDLMKSFGSLD